MILNNRSVNCLVKVLLHKAILKNFRIHFNPKMRNINENKTLKEELKAVRFFFFITEQKEDRKKRITYETYLLSA